MKLLNFVYEYRITNLFATYFRMLAKLQASFFNFYLKKNYLKTYPAYEKKLFIERLHLLRILKQIRCTIKKEDRKLLNKLEHLYEIIFSLHQLRFRVSDYSIFEVCHLEMQNLENLISNNLHQLITTVKKKSTMPSEKLLEKIHVFEAIYHRTLHVITPDPMVFLFFIQNLYALHDEILALRVMHENRL